MTTVEGTGWPVRRWNGWGDPAIAYPLPPAALEYLKSHLGSLVAPPDATYTEGLAKIPHTRLPGHRLVSTAPEDRLAHARGQSLPDWIALRSGKINTFPDGVAWPESPQDVRELLGYAKQSGVNVIPYGGGTSVVGHINPLPGERPVLTISLARMRRLLDLDPASRLANFEAGVSGPDLENQLKASGYTLGHFPQSFEGSTLGGWVATRSSGQQSYYYGRIEDLFAGGTLETFKETVRLPCLPASAAGPDLRQLILGSEGRLGLITEATVRVQTLPESEGFFGVFFRDWEPGVEAVRMIAQAGLRVSMLRLSNPLETETTLILSGKDRLVGMADRGLRLLRYGEQRCLLIFGVTGGRKATFITRQEVEILCRRAGGLPVGSIIGKTWQKSRFRTPYLRNTLWEHGVAIDTLETALPWQSVESATSAIMDAIRKAAHEAGEEVLSFAHLSHIYPDGASIYVTFLFRRSADTVALHNRWQRMKGAASQVIVAHQGTISHQHGVGLDHAAYLQSEKGALGLEALREMARVFDPDGLLNPGKLLPDREPGG
jgi:alkyldihydroxyacetonephosphate synthase